jgi:hypothetical protein
MLFATQSDFVSPPFLIPNFNASGDEGMLNPFADKAEIEGLKELMGLQFYSAMIEGIAALPAVWGAGPYSTDDLKTYGNKIYKSLVDTNTSVPGADANWEEQPDNIWLRLKVGNEFTYCGKTKIWEGMSTISIPLIMWKYIRYFYSQTTSNGIVESKTENSTRASRKPAFRNAYNPYAEAADVLMSYLKNTEDDFDTVAQDWGYTGIDEYVCEEFHSDGKIIWGI